MSGICSHLQILGVLGLCWGCCGVFRVYDIGAFKGLRLTAQTLNPKP